MTHRGFSVGERKNQSIWVLTLAEMGNIGFIIFFVRNYQKE